MVNISGTQKLLWVLFVTETIISLISELLLFLSKWSNGDSRSVPEAVC